MNAQTILLIDDESVVMNSTAGLLRSAGFSVYTCDFWPDVLRTIKDVEPSLILLDYNMPGLKGDEICSVLKRNFGRLGIKILIYSSEDESMLENVVSQCGADGYLSKTRGRAHVINGVCAHLGC